MVPFLSRPPFCVFVTPSLWGLFFSLSLWHWRNDATNQAFCHRLLFFSPYVFARGSGMSSPTTGALWPRGLVFPSRLEPRSTTKPSFPWCLDLCCSLRRRAAIQQPASLNRPPGTETLNLYWEGDILKRPIGASQVFPPRGGQNPALSFLYLCFTQQTNT